MRKQTLKNSRRLVGRRTYTAGELILILKIHRQTLRTWRKLGLAPIFTESRPWLYLGRNVKTFLKEQFTTCRCKLGPGEFYCLRCKVPRGAVPGSSQVVLSGKKLGGGKLAAMMMGECKKCGCKMCRAASIESQVTKKEGASTKEVQED